MNLKEFFFNSIAPLHQLYYEIECKGFRVDEEVRSDLLTKYKGDLKLKQEELDDITETKFNFNSPKQVGTLLYTVWRVPFRAGTDEDTLNALIANNVVKDERKKRGINLILQCRKSHKTINTYLEAKCDEDGRMRGAFNTAGTETGRTSTQSLGLGKGSKNPYRYEKRGLSWHTITKHTPIGRDIRSMFIPDPGFVFVECDESQADARTVFVLAEMYETLDKMNSGFDIHRETASWIYLKDMDQINEDPERQVGKHSGHACSFDMGKHRFRELLSGFEVNLSEWKCGQILEVVHQHRPGIRANFHTGVQKALEENNMVLVTPLGRRRQFFDKFGPEMFKEAYAHIPQSVTGDVIKTGMLRMRSLMDQSWNQNFWRFLLESHDSFLAQVREDIVPQFCQHSKECIEREIDFNLCSVKRDYKLIIPVEFKIGTKNWMEMKKYKV